jgi:23S rRNA (uracil1939-C5)-methyltransferase
VAESLRRIGGFESPPMLDPVPAPEIFEYRNKMEFSFAVDRDSGEMICGLHYAGRFDRVFDLQECHLVPPSFANSVIAARAFLRQRHVPAYHQREHTGHARFLVVRSTLAGADLLLNFVTTSEDYALREGFVAALREAVPEITGIVHTSHDGRAQIAVGDEVEVWYGRDIMTEQLGDLAFDLSPQSFFQTNSRQAAALYELTLKAAQPQGDEIALDLYCGTGTIGLYLAPHVKEVHGVEQIEETALNATENARRNNITNARFECADVMKWLKAESELVSESGAPLLVIVDPPRAGLHPDVPPVLTAAQPRRIVYVSCNPATLARDAALLHAGGYTLQSATPVDMFPHTAHIETVALFEPE